MIQVIVKVLDCIFDIVKNFLLLEVIFWLFTGNRNFIGEEISSSSIFGDFFNSTIVNGKVASVYFLGGNPENIRVVMSFLLDFVDEVISVGIFNGWVLLEGEFDLYFFLLHIFY